MHEFAGEKDSKMSKVCKTMSKLENYFHEIMIIAGGITNSGNVDWPPLDSYEAPYREPILAPTTNSYLAKFLPSPSKFNNQRLPRNLFLPSLPDYSE